MQPRHLAVPLALALALAAVPAQAQQSTQRSISVAGSATVSAANDTAGFTTGVSMRRSTPGAALRSTSAAMAKVIAAVRARGVAERDIRTQHVGVHRTVRRSHGRRIVTYLASNSVFVTVREIARTGGTIDAAIAAGATRLDGPTFWRSNTNGLYRQALVRALHKARDKAEVLATDSGETLGEVLSITESGAQVYEYAAGDSTAARPSPATPIQPGRTRVTADLTAVFAIS